MCLIYILVLNGLPESGKDTFASFIANRFKGKVVMHSTVDTVKLMALEWFGVEFDVDKNEKKRRLWSDMDQLDRMADRFLSLLGFTGYLESRLKGLCKWQSAPTD